MPHSSYIHVQESDGLACCKTDSRERAVLVEVSVAAEVLLLLSISPRSLCGVDLGEADDVISSSLSCSSSLVLSCTKSETKSIIPAAILVISATIIALKLFKARY